MWYVLQVSVGQEKRFCQLIQQKMDTLIEDCFFLQRERIKKFGGKFRKIEEILFPGYIFLITEKNNEVDILLKQDLQLSRLLQIQEIRSKVDSYLQQLNESEVNFVRRWGGKSHFSKISTIHVKDKNEIEVVAGNLKEYEQEIIKVNLHQRTAVIQILFLGRIMNIYMGFQILGNEELV